MFLLFPTFMLLYFFFPLCIALWSIRVHQFCIHTDTFVFHYLHTSLLTLVCFMESGNFWVESVHGITHILYRLTLAFN